VINLISLLREERVAIINQAITKGINPTAPMKDSGISWLGEIPEHWTVGKLKYLCELITDGSHYSPITLEVGKRYISVKDVKDNTVDFSDCKYISAHDFAQLERNGCRPKKDDILLTKDGTIGRAAIVSDDNDFVILSSLAIIRPFKEKVHFEYLKYFLLSSINIDQMLSSLQGSALTRITLTIINNLLTVIPPIDEQLAILTYIKIKEQQLDKLFIREEREIELLKEYKVALISEVVTGKVDVRNEVLTELTELAL
jgi:type I restriction enzyme S subunit